MYKHFLKYIFDFILSLCGTILLLPFFLIMIVAIKIDSRGPIFFRQNRIGKNKRIFRILKFRTMRVDAPKDVPTHQLENPEKYITRVGKFLRRTSLDELPQILNILTGKMSIVGPRPALWNQDDLIIERDKYGANALKPGLTGWAQVNGRDELEIPIKAALDGEYVKKRGFFFDIKIMFLTVFKVFRSDGVKEGKKTVVNESEPSIEQTEIATADCIDDNQDSLQDVIDDVRLTNDHVSDDSSNDTSEDIINEPQNYDAEAENQDESEDELAEEAKLLDIDKMKTDVEEIELKAKSKIKNIESA